MERVLALCQRLRANGVNAWVDQYETSPPEGWPFWSVRQVREADFVLIICTESYARRFRGEEKGHGLGTRWEGHIVAQELYDGEARNTKFIPILLDTQQALHIPAELRGTTRYDLSTDDGYWQLYRYLTGQPATQAAELGSLVPLPIRERRADFERPFPPMPRFADERMQELTESFLTLKKQLKDLTISDQDTTSVREDMLRLRREMREGGRLQSGDFLQEGRYHLLEVLGRGGFATVWKAWDDQRQELVAVKVLHGLYADDRSRLERFFRGARKMEGLHHPGIARVLDCHLEDGGHHFFVMELVAGGDLQRAVLDKTLLPQRAIPILLAVGEALSYAHSQGVIHRDLKPGNILLDTEGPKLTDFDLVYAIDTTGGTRTNAMLGTLLYTAPEILNNAKTVTVTADVYSLAMTTLFVLAGCELPLDVVRRPERFVESLACPPRVRSLLLCSISWDSQDRPGSVASYCEELERSMKAM